MRANPVSETIGDVLGFARPRSVSGDLALMDSVDAGLPLAALDEVAARVAPDDKTFRFKLVSRATLARRGGEGRSLTSDQGAKVARLAKAWISALDVWKEADAARAFLWRPHALLNGMTPVDVVLRSEFGGPLVESVLRRLEHGTAV